MLIFSSLGMLFDSPLTCKEYVITKLRYSLPLRMAEHRIMKGGHDVRVNLHNFWVPYGCRYGTSADVKDISISGDPVRIGRQGLGEGDQLLISRSISNL